MYVKMPLSLLFDNGLSPAAPELSNVAAEPSSRKRQRWVRSCKNKKESETQRIAHISVECNRRRLMNEHLAMLRFLMPKSYIQRGGHASIVSVESTEGSSSNGSSQDCSSDHPPFAQFSYPQYFWCHSPRVPQESRPAVADIEVTLVMTHTMCLSPWRPWQLLKMVAGLQSLRLTIFDFNVTTLDSMILYSLSTKSTLSSVPQLISTLPRGRQPRMPICGVVVKGPKLGGNISGKDPLKDNRLLLEAEALDDTKDAKHTAAVVNELSKEISKILVAHPLNAKRATDWKSIANVILLRDCGIRLRLLLLIYHIRQILVLYGNGSTLLSWSKYITLANRASTK